MNAEQSRPQCPKICNLKGERAESQKANIAVFGSKESGKPEG
jgi:hypothetical protein